MKHTAIPIILIVLACILATSVIVYAEDPDIDSEGFLWPIGEGEVSLPELPTAESFVMESSTTSFTPVDLLLWNAESYPPVPGFPEASWVKSSSEHVRQFNNAQPTLFYSDFPALWTELMVVTGVGCYPNYDDDYIGLAVGFQPGDTSNPSADFLVVDWKRADQWFDFGEPSCTPGSWAYRGLAVSRVFGVPTADEFWGHTNFDSLCSDSNNGMEELARGNIRGDTGWPCNATDTFRILYTPTRLIVYVNGQLEADITGTFGQGRWAFYNFSQDQNRYSWASVRYLVVPVTIDIKPGSDPNCFNNDGNGIIPVAILTTETFDAATVDPSSLSLDGAGVRVKGKSGNAGSLEDVNNDGYLDLVVQIEDVDGTYQPGEAIATLTGVTFDGNPILGEDTICIVP